MTRTEAAAYIAGLTATEKRRLNELLKRMKQRREGAPIFEPKDAEIES